MRLAGATVLPYRYSHYAHKISEFLDDAGGWAVDNDDRQIVRLGVIVAGVVGWMAASSSNFTNL